MQVLWEKRDRWPEVACVIGLVFFCVGGVWIAFQTLMWLWP